MGGGEQVLTIPNQGSEIKLLWNLFYLSVSNGELDLYIFNNYNKKRPIIAQMYILKNDVKVQSSGRASVEANDLNGSVLRIHNIKNNLEQIVDEKGTLTIRVEITILQPELDAGSFESFVKDMSALRDKASNFSDLNISCQGKSFPVHRALLAARSDVFLAMLMHDTKEANEQKIEINDVDPDTMEIFLQYIYGSKLPQLDTEQASSLMILGDKYNVSALMEACRLRLLEDLQSCDLVQVAILGYFIKDEELKNAAISKMGKEVRPLNELKDWSKLRSYPDLALEMVVKMKK